MPTRRVGQLRNSPLEGGNRVGGQVDTLPTPCGGDSGNVHSTTVHMHSSPIQLGAHLAQPRDNVRHRHPTHRVSCWRHTRRRAHTATTAPVCARSSTSSRKRRQSSKHTR